MTPTIGRIVHYHLDAGPHKGEPRPAVIVCVWNDDCLNLQVLTDGANDGEKYATGVYWATSSTGGAEPGKWVWPVRT